MGPVQGKEGRYSAGRAFVRFVCRIIIVLWQEWERVSEASGQYDTIDSRQDLNVESVVETHSKLKEARLNSQYRS